MTPASNTSFPNVTTPIALRGKALRARVYLPAHQPGLADGGLPGERYIDYHRQRAKAGLGMQITGATPVLWSEVWADGLTLVNIDDRIIPGYRELARAVHDEGGLMLAQLAHVGAMETTGDAIVSASWERSELTHQMSREATAEELAEIAGLYRAAARRCREGDLDGVEVTMAHGMLLASFLSPLMNRREDGYGGGLEGRTRFPREVLAAVREAMGEGAIVGIRIPGDEMLADGIGPAEAASIARRLVATGMVDYVSVTAGNNTRKLARVDHWPPTPAPFGAFRHLSRAVREAVEVPVATVGRVTTLDLAEEILAAGDADLVGMVRANVADPRLLPKALAAAPKTIRPCIGANVCINSLLDHKPLTCMVNPEVGRPPSTIDRPIGAARSAVVVGAGPAGLEAARRLALRGFGTTLVEADDRLGGQMDRWSRTASRQEFRKILRWWEDELARLGVGLELGAPAEAGDILRRRPSVVLLATGSAPIADREIAFGGTPTYGPYDVPEGGGHVLVRDEMGRLAAMLTAERLAATWKKVTLVTSAMHPGEGEGITTAYTLVRALGRLGVEIVDRAKLVRVEAGRAVLKGVFEENRPAAEGVEAVVSLIGAVSHTPLLAELRAKGVDVRRIGDAKLPRDVTAAVRDAAETVWSLDAGNDADADAPRLSQPMAAGASL
ncbi:dimethylglycine catabolism protein DgcA [Aureimonas endophytica]|uniref:Dimethylglycine catabolism protein DgcA n=1 Tax=Aureimonas endophytica TaxID=2027858 RepID=A0A916ZKB2_9HYPH|nr:NAD-binding protein [Aureimonas endophytica]GGE01396.1 dimethylglycine catabolism protein DgcA [Aureimonas endophytica]